MPKALEAQLIRSYEMRKGKLRRKGVTEDQYVYGAMRKMGWKPKRERK